MPNTSWRKSNIQEWLTNQDIAFSEDLFKSKLLLMVAQSTGGTIWTQGALSSTLPLHF